MVRIEDWLNLQEAEGREGTKNGRGIEEQRWNNRLIPLLCMRWETTSDIKTGNRMLVKALQAWESISNIKRNGTVCIASGSGLLYLHHYLTYKIARVILFSEKNRTQEIIPFNNNKSPTNKSISWEIHICGKWNVRQGGLRMNWQTRKHILNIKYGLAS